MTEVLSIDWMHALGWTFLHSLWQAALILLIVHLALRVIPLKHSNTRYGIAVASIILFIITTAATWLYLSKAPVFPETDAWAANTATSPLRPGVDSSLDSSSSPLVVLMNSIEQSMGWILIFWSIGFIFFTIRLSAGLYYTWRIRSSALLIDNEWNAFIREAAQRMGISRWVMLAQTQAISSPVVVGYLKPVILIPAGMLTGLTTEQLETVFLHELAHIRRHDYLINLAQSVVEAIFFFNPFVWVLSEIIRREREYCCDDIVIRWHGSGKAYAYALTKLAEARLAVPGLALPLANDKNQLLDRIRRIMETSVKDSRKRKFAIPVLLLVGALMCISWLGMENAGPDVAQPDMTSAADTLPDQKGIASYSRKSIITIDENGQPHEEVIEEFNGDESLRPLIQERFQILPDTSVQGFPSLPSDAGLSRWMDTIPPLGFRGDKEWREFAEAMQENFRKHFESFQHLQDDSLFMQRFADRWKSFEIPGEAFRALEKFEQDEAFKHMEEELQRFRDLDLERFRRMGEDFAQPFRNRTEGYEDALRKQLLEDGYLKENESIGSLEWTNESFKVNGKSIDRDDRKKYQELNDRFFGNQP